MSTGDIEVMEAAKAESPCKLAQQQSHPSQEQIQLRHDAEASEMVQAIGA